MFFFTAIPLCWCLLLTHHHLLRDRPSFWSRFSFFSSRTIKHHPHLTVSLQFLLPDSALCRPCNPRSLHKPKRNNTGFPKVFLGGLPANVTESDLRAFFNRYGQVMEVVIMYDQEKKKSRGFGFLSVSWSIAFGYLAITGRFDTYRLFFCLSAIFSSKTNRLSIVLLPITLSTSTASRSKSRKLSHATVRIIQWRQWIQLISAPAHGAVRWWAMATSRLACQTSTRLLASSNGAHRSRAITMARRIHRIRRLHGQHSGATTTLPCHRISSNQLRATAHTTIALTTHRPATMATDKAGRRTLGIPIWQVLRRMPAPRARLKSIRIVLSRDTICMRHHHRRPSRRKISMAVRLKGILEMVHTVTTTMNSKAHRHLSVIQIDHALMVTMSNIRHSKQ